MQYPKELVIGVLAFLVVAGAIWIVSELHWFEMHHGPLTAIATVVIGMFTATLWWTARNQLNHTQAIERAYLTGGGDIIVDRVTGKPVPDSSGRLQFRVDVGNYGKTPAIITHYDVHFDVLANVRATLKPVSPSEEFRDQIAPSQEKSIAVIPVQPNTDIIYGAFWYWDIWKKKQRHFRFILRIETNHRTRPTVPGVDKGYWDWS